MSTKKLTMDGLLDAVHGTGQLTVTVNASLIGAWPFWFVANAVRVGAIKLPTKEEQRNWNLWHMLNVEQHPEHYPQEPPKATGTIKGDGQ